MIPRVDQIKGWALITLPTLKGGNLIWFTKNQNYLRDALLPENVTNLYELWIFSKDPITYNGNLIESDEMCFDNRYSAFHSPVETCDDVWELFVKAFYLSLSRYL